LPLAHLLAHLRENRALTMTRKSPDDLRSARWFAPDDLRSFGHRSRAMQMGYSPDDWAGKPIIAVVNTWSDINMCHAHFRQRAEDVKRGILQAGGFPLELPAISLSEQFVKPTTMLYRNFLAMETEELLRSHPVDGAVLMGGCDKTTPGLLMGAISAGYPAIFMPPAPCCAAITRAKRSAPARTAGNTGTSGAQAISAPKNGKALRAGLPDPTAIA
jgi:dihydroxy-acid dehydratase